ncbi:glucosaminidase domain-containing protein [Fructilactobacillus myrtifloralis]|uniref:glucosaminidase domain-containing protein n=1 Tax=Fructilactobacillus myrtifloralis TaxID=2940301 RepID=UPI00237D2F70|nr:glucosaminidase domain-containing protein [Fructilactobacillus myrtifloralis]
MKQYQRNRQLMINDTREEKLRHKLVKSKKGWLTFSLSTIFAVGLAFGTGNLTVSADQTGVATTQQQSVANNQNAPAPAPTDSTAITTDNQVNGSKPENDQEVTTTQSSADGKKAADPVVAENNGGQTSPTTETKVNNTTEPTDNHLDNQQQTKSEASEQQQTPDATAEQQQAEVKQNDEPDNTTTSTNTTQQTKDSDVKATTDETNSVNSQQKTKDDQPQSGEEQAEAGSQTVSNPKETDKTSEQATTANESESQSTQQADTKLPVASTEPENKQSEQSQPVNNATSVKIDPVLSSQLHTNLASTNYRQFIDSLAAGAIETWHRYGVLPSISIAQGILESGWGSSTPGNNLFGIKGSYNGQYVTVQTREWINGRYVTIYDRFRAYPSFKESILDHGAFLANNPRYANLLHNRNYAEVARLLQADGYATDPNYASSLIGIIRYNKLDQYDSQADFVINAEKFANADGDWTFSQSAPIYWAPSQNAYKYGEFHSGWSVHYNGTWYDQEHNLTWLRYADSNGTHYVPRYGFNVNDVNVNTNESGTWTFSQSSPIYNGAPSHEADQYGEFKPGWTVEYSGTVDLDGTTWLRYFDGNGVHYVPKVGFNVNSIPLNNESGTWTFSQTAPIYNGAPSEQADHYGEFHAGWTVEYAGTIDFDGTTWLRYFDSNGVHYVPKVGFNVSSVPLNNESGTWTFSESAPIYSGAPSYQADHYGDFHAGWTVNYAGTVDFNGTTWLRYFDGNGVHYVPKVGVNVNNLPLKDENGTWTFSEPASIYSGAPSDQADHYGEFHAGWTVNYAGTVDFNGTTWLRYFDSNGAHYVPKVGVNVNSLPVKDENGTWTFSEPAPIYSGAPSDQADHYGDFHAGWTVDYTGTVDFNGITWLRYFDGNGVHYVPKVGVNVNDLPVKDENGTWEFSQAAPIYSGAPTAQAEHYGAFLPGWKVNYTGTVDFNGTTWLRYFDGKGVHYVPAVGFNVQNYLNSTQGGTWTFNQGATIYDDAPSFQSTSENWFRPGWTLHYDSTYVKDGVTWMRYSDKNGVHYVPQVGINLPENTPYLGAIRVADQYLGEPYSWGGSKPWTGFDCSGLTQWSYGQIGVTLPRVSEDQWRVTKHISQDEARAGDLIFFSRTYDDGSNYALYSMTHVGIYLGNGYFLSSNGKGITIDTVASWNMYPTFFGRI